MNEKSTNESTDHNRKILTVRVASLEDAFVEVKDRFAMLDAGRQPEPLYEIVLQREADINRLLSPKTLELLRLIAREQPASIRETARLVDRDIHQVHDNLTELERLNLIYFETDGRAKRPVVWYDDIDIELPITDETDSRAAA